MKNDKEQERQENLKDNIDDTENTIKNIQIIIQGLREVKDKAIRYDEKIEIQKLIERNEREIDFLNDIQESDLRALEFY